MASSSFHTLNADGGLDPIRALLWRSANALRNRYRPFRAEGLEVRPFRFEPDGRDEPGWERIYPTASPARALSDFFWMTRDWAAIERALGPIRVLDVGCGQGQYGPKLQEASGGRIARYHGVDARARDAWRGLEERHPWIGFTAATAREALRRMPEGTNLVVSQSALEHLEDDLGLFRALRAWVDRVDGPVLQIHLVPSAECLALYGLHGVRQYHPRSLAGIARLFAAPDTRTVAFRLGGPSCNRLHREFISGAAGDRREAEGDEYRRRLRSAIAEDLARPEGREATFYALVIQSRAGDGDGAASGPTRPPTIGAA